MNNEKGFTLVEILVSIGLLAIIGGIIGVSIVKSYKNSQADSYNEFIDKVKSSSMLYVNNTAQIINDLNTKASFKLIKIGELIDNGYISSNLINPDTGEKISREDIIKISYNSDSELVVEYPYNNNYNEAYLYALNYTTTFKSTENDICYKGLNTSSLQLVNENGDKVRDLQINQNIKAYLEDGSECTSSKINTSQIGTYIIRYNYTIDASNINNSKNIKSATRTIIIKPSKPLITKFIIDYQIPFNNNGYDSFKAKMTLEAHDVEGIKLKYCLIPTDQDDDVNKLILKCNNQINNQNIGGSWIDYTNNNGNQIILNYDLNNYNDIKDMTDIKFYIFVKNEFEEYSSKLNEVSSGIYQFKRKVTLNAGKSNVSNDKYAKFSDGTTSVTLYTKYGITFKDFINDYNNQKYKNPIISDNQSESNNYVFEGWQQDGTDNVHSSDSNFRITSDIGFTGKWYKYCSSTIYTGESSCIASCGSNGSKYIYYSDSKYTSHSCPTRTQICYGGDCPPPTPPSSGGDSGSSGEDSGGSSGPVCLGYNTSCDCQDNNGWYTITWYNNTLKQNVCQCCCCR